MGAQPATDGLTRLFEIFGFHPAKSSEQIVKRLSIVNKGRERSVAQYECLNRLAARDSPLMMFHVFEKRFQSIVGGRHVRDSVTTKQAPPTMADSLHDPANDLRLVGAFFSFLFQPFQELLDFPFDLTGRPHVTLFIARLK